MRFDVWMRAGSLVDMVQKFRCRIQLAATFASFQGMSTDDLLPYGNGSDILPVLHLDHLGGTYVGTGSATDAKTLDRYDKVLGTALFHLKRAGTDNFLADADTQPAADAAIGQGARIDPIGFSQISDGLRLWRHLQQVTEGSSPGPIDQFPLGVYHQIRLDFENASQHRQLTARTGLDLHRA